ncbi:GNAT family N-acetyltransferase [Fulvivirgaceae bacterium PWU4]|uniref:GNAT family N-acetyltransferase n=1 Tax=Chryseosolibacter histidini TaxID=2782349 RepID=A0AAP2DVH2_9BACT|nr:GNAT family N-acetyltransferase [Chryseosolibacter histidini]MBT1701474.1 GNAT family N-acetyltransferase [Chryseosolibacter histidini]
MTVRKSTLEDIAQLAVLFDRYRVFYNKESDVENAAIFLSERIESRDSEIFVAEAEDGVLAGFVQLYPLFSSTRMKRLWLLNDLYVDPRYRGKHVSVMLIDRAKQLVKETNAVGLILETTKSNVVGNTLYPRTGFTLDEEHNYYSWGE